MPVATEQARLELVHSPPEDTVWLFWCRGEEPPRTEKALRALGKAAKFGSEYCRVVVGEPFPPASRPGEPPRKRTGLGGWSIEWGTHRGHWAGFVRSVMPPFIDFQYMAYHDEKDRPWLLASLAAIRGDLERRIERWLNG